MGAIADLLTTYERRGVRFWIDKGELRYRAARGLVSSAEIDALRARRTEILLHLLHQAAGSTAAASADLAPLPRWDRPENVPLSFAQERLWFLERMGRVGAAYHIPGGVRLTGALNVEVLERALDRILTRHEGLRTRFLLRDGKPCQLIEPDTTGFALRRIDLRQAPELPDLQTLCLQELQAPFDLERGPLIRGQLLQLADQEHVLLLTVHHIVCDGWSIGVFLHELSVLYSAFCHAAPDPLPALSIQYADYALWQRQYLRGPALEEHLRFWRTHLAAAPGLIELPTDRPRPAVQSYRGGAVRVQLPKQLVAGLKSLSQHHGVTLFMALLAGWSIVLSRLSGQEDVVIGTPVANRGRRELEPLIGIFVNTLALRVRAERELSVAQLLARIRAESVQAYAHQDVPFEQVVEALQPPRNLSHSPIFQVMLVLNNTPRRVGLAGLQLQELEPPGISAKFDLTLSLMEETSGIQGALEYASDLFEADTARGFGEYFTRVLAAMVADPNTLIRHIAMLCADERYTLLDLFNTTAAAYPRESCIHELFEQQVRRTPQAEALIYEERRLTYAQLNARANQLAHYLRGLGVGPESRVVICLERSLEMVVGLLGILKAGGAYVPLDPSYPAERLNYVLKDSAPDVVLTQGSILARLEARAARALVLDGEQDTLMIGRESHEDIACEQIGLTPKNMAYVIYTSGSTGQPKGAGNEHAGVVNRLCWAQREYGVGVEDRVLQKTPFGFDVSVWEFFLPLWSGARLVVARPGGHQEPAYLLRVIEQQQITLAHFVPSMLQVFVDQATGGCCPSLRRVLCSGEALSRSLQDRFFQVLPHAELHNLYGPTEAAIDVTYWQCRPEEPQASVPIGRPVANTQMYILDSYQQPVPVGVTGEIYIGGVQVGRGYLNRAGLTAERFIADPFRGGRLYRTGDLGRWRREGVIDYLGRNDFQVKIRGLRIELGEIEARLRGCRGVDEAVVTAAETTSGDRRLVAYVKPTAGCSAWNAPTYILPNGEVIFHHNTSETRFLYREIYESRGYLRDDAPLPEDACVLDVGANIGLFTLYIARICPKGTIYAFEPMPPLLETLSRNASLCAAQVEVFPYGLGNETTDAELTYYHGNSIISGRKRGSDLQQDIEIATRFLATQSPTELQSQGLLAAAGELLAERMQGEVYTCHLRPLSEVMRERGIEHVDLLKIDVERAEWDVLQGIASDDWQRIDRIVVEVHDRIEGYDGSRISDVTCLLRDHGYVVSVWEDEALHGSGIYNVHATRPSYARHPRNTPSANRTTPRERALTARILRIELQRVLPDYMIPTEFVALESMPLNTNGKLDRKALPLPGTGAFDSRKFEPPQGEVEPLLASVWAELLGRPRVGRQDNFFELGGHSLLAVQMTARVRSLLGVEIALAQVFAHPVLEALARCVASAAIETLPALSATERAESIPLSFAQERLWFLEQMGSVGTAYHIPGGVRLTGALNVEVLERALDRILTRHEGLRTRFLLRDGKPCQLIEPDTTGFALRLTDLRQAPELPDLQTLYLQELQAPFDLERGPLIRGQLLQLADQEHVLLLTVHHIVCDGWSIGVFLHELSVLYSAFCHAAPDPLPALTVQYADYALWQRQCLRGELLEEQLQFWRTHLVGAPGLIELPTDRPRPAVQSYRGAAVRVQLPKRLVAGLESLSQHHGVTLFMALLAGWSIVLSRLSGQEELVIGTPVANRGRRELEPLIGIFVNTLALRVRAEWELSVAQLLGRIRAEAVQAYAHQDVPFEQVVEALQPPRNLSHSPIFQVMLVLNNTPRERGAGLAGLQLQELEPPGISAKFDLTLSLMEATSGIQGALEYASDLFEADSARGFGEYFGRVLEAMVADPNTLIGRIQMLAVLPAKLAALESMPLNVNRKLDRKSLPTPEAGALVSREFEPPQGEIEHLLASVWAELLQRPRVGRYDNFFELGGHSLLAVQMTARVRSQLGIEIALPQVFAHPVLEAFARCVVAAAGATLPAISAAERAESVPLSFAQERLWFLEQMGRVGAAYHLPGGVRLTGELNVHALKRALDRILARHEGLRTRFLLRDGKPCQLIEPDTTGFALRRIDLRQAPELPDLQTLYLHELQAPFDLQRGPLIRGQLLQLADQEHVLLMTVHHIVCDGWSIGVFLHELSVLYSAFCHAAPDPLPALSIQYADYALWQRQCLRGQLLEEQLQFWRTNLVAAPGLIELPTDRPRPAVQSYRGGGVRVQLPRQLVAGLESLSQHHGVTLFMALLAGWAIVLSRLSGQEEVVIGTPVANRGRKELEPLMGIFLNTLALRVRAEWGLSVAQLLGRIRAEAVQAYAHQDVPFEQVVEALQPPRNLSHSPIFQVMLALNNTPRQERVELVGLALQELEQPPSSSAKFDLTLSLLEETSGIQGVLEYASDLFEAASARGFGEYFGRVLEVMVAEPNTLIGRIQVLAVLPARLVALESMPHNANRTLNRKALPSPDHVAVRSEAYEAPVGDMETTIVEVWQRVLRKERIGRHDDFFETGGHSLLAIVACQQASQVLLREVPVVLLFTHSTVAKLTAALQGMVDSRSQSHCVKLRTVTGARHAVCFVPTIFGLGSTFFAHWAGRLTAPVDALSVHLPLGMSPADTEAQPWTSIEATARYCLALLAGEPYESYILVGWSYGGVVAHEMARQLTLDGISSRLVLIDSYLLPSEVATGKALPEGIIRQMFEAELRASSLPESVADGASSDSGIFARYQTNLHALARHVPSVCNVPAVEIRATESEAKLQWARYAPRTLPLQRVEQIVVSGDHYSVVTGKGLATIIGAIDQVAGQ